MYIGIKLEIICLINELLIMIGLKLWIPFLITANFWHSPIFLLFPANKFGGIFELIYAQVLIKSFLEHKIEGFLSYMKYTLAKLMPVTNVSPVVVSLKPEMTAI